MNCSVSAQFENSFTCVKQIYYISGLKKLNENELINGYTSESGIK